MDGKISHLLLSSPSLLILLVTFVSCSLTDYPVPSHRWNSFYQYILRTACACCPTTVFWIPPANCWGVPTRFLPPVALFLDPTYLTALISVVEFPSHRLLPTSYHRTSPLWRAISLVSLRLHDTIDRLFRNAESPVRSSSSSQVRLEIAPPGEGHYSNTRRQSSRSRAVCFSPWYF
ncbi:hypothetical protein B0T18DRAFT_153772 [Schizothecium vesticola]|uniref:Uncharacterized protein n=1 Tax=Schizothecium vesticola TaxID=314040 RepID=A0AA40EVV1_9PEZI|nr:hypothetical protein B0T18DRAFT_153772 [Schizothecium vesticola]